MTNRQKKALAALISSPTVKAAAKASGVGYSTIRRWLKDDTEFAKAYRDAASDIMDDAIFLARNSITPALMVLRQIIGDKEQNGAVRSQASRTLLEYGAKLTERADVLSRLERLEEAMQENEQ
jgi:hypothetical protein